MFLNCYTMFAIVNRIIPIVIICFYSWNPSAPGVVISNPSSSRGSPIGLYKHAAVAADNGACSEIGKNIIQHGGNAVESIIATAICIGVHDPHSSGLGGGHFLTVYSK